MDERLSRAIERWPLMRNVIRKFCDRISQPLRGFNPAQMRGAIEAAMRMPVKH